MSNKTSHHRRRKRVVRVVTQKLLADFMVEKGLTDPAQITREAFAAWMETKTNADR